MLINGGGVVQSKVVQLAIEERSDFQRLAMKQRSDIQRLTHELSAIQEFSRKPDRKFASAQVNFRTLGLRAQVSGLGYML